jgi:pilus assembly protein Flp/PilA
MDSLTVDCETLSGEPNEPDNPVHLDERGENQMTELFLHAFLAVQGAHRSLLQRARTERGASMVEYALLVGLIAVVAVVAVSLLGQGIKGLFNQANTCVGGLNSTSC